MNKKNKFPSTEYEPNDFSVKRWDNQSFPTHLLQAQSTEFVFAVSLKDLNLTYRLHFWLMEVPFFLQANSGYRG